MERLIDLKTLLAPLPGESPSGQDILGLPDNVAIEDAARGIEAEDPGHASSGSLSRLATLCLNVLSTGTKDLRVVSRLGQALAMKDGFSGAASSVELARCLIEGYWDTLHPQLEDGDAGYRRASVEQMANRMSHALQFYPLTTASGPRYGYAHYLDARHVDQLRKRASYTAQDGVTMSGEQLYREALEDGRIDGDMFIVAIDNTPGEEILALANALAECEAELTKLEDAWFSFLPNKEEQPDLIRLRDTLAGCAAVLETVISRRGLRGPSSASEGVFSSKVDESPAMPVSGHESSAGGDLPTALTATQLASREQLLQTLERIGLHFARTEPHSPVSFMIDRAVTWARLPLDKVLEEMVEDVDSRRRIEKLIGIRREE